MIHMISVNLFTILVFSMASALMGFFFLRVAIQGKLISLHPHCRKCKYDLIDLDLTNPTPCPECGTTLRMQTPAITVGLRKTRKLAILASIFFLLTAATGLAWPKLSKLPSIQSINIYDHFPEALLTKLATIGNDEAFQTLHDRLIPGQVSNQALQKLIDHAFILQADESTPWDERWGDVLLYAFVDEHMAPDQFQMYLERSIVIEVEMHEEIGQNHTKLNFMRYWKANSRGKPSPGFHFQWEHAPATQPAFTQYSAPYKYMIRTYRPYLQEGPEPQRSSGGTSPPDPDQPGWWVPYTQSGAGTGTEIQLPKETQRMEYVFKIDVTAFKDNAQVHTWTKKVSKVVRRAENPKYISIVSDPLVAKEVARGWTFSPIRVPTKIQEAMKHKRIRDSHLSLFSANPGITSPHGLLGTLWLSNGNDELKFTDVAMSTKERHGYGLGGPNASGAKGSSWLDFYANNEEFWAKILERGSVDVIYRPDPSMAEDNPRLESMVNLPIIFRDVPLVKLIPKLKPIGQGRNGPVVNTWTLSPINEMEVGRSYTPAQMAQFRGPEGVAGELMEEE